MNYRLTGKFDIKKATKSIFCFLAAFLTDEFYVIRDFLISIIFTIA